MKQEATKKNRKWLIPVIALAAVLVIAGVVLALVLPSQQSDAEEPAGVKLYWNVDRAMYIEEETGMSTRQPGEDGLYHVRFAVDGGQVELPVADKRLVNYIDSMDLMGLELDDGGAVIDAVDPKTIATETAKDVYVKFVDADTVTLNSSKAMNGMDMVVELTDKTGIYNVDSIAVVVGQVDECETMDQVRVYSNEAGEVTHVFITERAPEADVYLRVDQFYDSDTGMTSREPDENGVYTILFAHNGQQVELKCKDKKLVNKIDGGSDANRHLGLIFDDEGYIIDYISAAMALRGKLLCNTYNITAIDGNTVTAERLMSGSEQGKTCSFTLTDDTQIYTSDDGCVFDFQGQRVDRLVEFDRIICYTDLEDNALLIYLVKRTVDCPMYYNITRMTSNGVPTRKPDANGYYVFEMTVEGKLCTLKTKDKELAEKIDVNSWQMMGLKVEGSIIQAYYDPSCVSGWSGIGQSRYVTESMGSIVKIVSGTDFTSGGNFLIGADSKIYDVTGDYGVEYGSATTLQKYDRINAFKNVYGEVSHAYVLSRYHEGTKLYYSISRLYDAEKKETTRIPDENGYYVYEMICEGKTVTVKTKNKALASEIDEQNAPIIAMKVTSAGIVKEAYQAISGIRYGAKKANYNYVGKLGSDGTFNTYYYSDGEKKWQSETFKLADNCVIYNVSTVYSKYRGEKTSLQLDDRIQAFMDRETGEIVQIFVMERKVDSSLYWHVKRYYSSTKQETTRVPDVNGYYVFELAVDGKVKSFKTKDKAIASAVDAMSTSEAFTLRLSGDTILGVYPATAARGITGQPAGFRDIMKISGNKMTLVRNRPAAEDYGASTELTFAKNCRYYDVSYYSENFGAEVKPQLGDRLKVYTNYEGEVICCFIVYKNVRQDGHVSLCEHCGKEVFWEPFVGTLYEADAHYYLPSDRTMKQVSIGSSDEGKPQYDIVFDLNGHTLSSPARNFLVYSTLSIMDTAGGGKVEAAGVGGYGGNIMVIQGGALNLYSGTLQQSQGSTDSKDGGVLFVNSGSTVNMYGGTITGGHVSGNGGNIYLNNSTFNMSGGTVSGGIAQRNGSGIYMASSKVNITGGTVSGDVYVNTGTELNLSGAPVISGAGLQFAGGAKLSAAELTKGAAVMVAANGAFTEELKNAENCKAFFTPALSCARITVRDNVLYCQTDFTAELAFEEGTTKAACPACARTVEWTALTAEAATLVKGNHYYLNADITFEETKAYLSGSTAESGRGTVCLHLNGHNITATKHRAINLCKATLNVMGTGTVSGNFIGNTNQGATLYAGYAAGRLNLYGGTFTKAESNTTNPAVTQLNGIINLYDGAAIESADSDLRIYVSNGGDTPRFYMYGGSISGNVYVDAGTFKLSGGTVSGDIALGSMNVSKSSTDKTQITCYATLDMTGGTVTGSMDVTAPNTVTLSGSSVISGCINVAQGAAVTVGELSNGAAFVVFADGAFAQSDNAEVYSAYFKPAIEGDAITADGNSLVYKMQVRTVTEKLAFINGSNKAVCPVCNKIVTWIPLDQATYGETGYGTIKNNGDHFYLAENIAYTGTTAAFITAPGQITDTTGKVACLHLNGHDLTATKQRPVFGSSGILNIMGTGTVSGNFTNQKNVNDGAVLAINTNRIMGAINLYSGTYVKAAGNTQTAVTSINNNGGRIRVYSDAQLVSEVEEYGIYVGTANLTDAEVTVEGSVAGRVHLTGANADKGFTSVLNMNGGSIAGGVIVDLNNAVNLSGKAVIADAGLDLTSGARVTLGELTDGASIAVTANGVFTEAHEKAADYAKYFAPTGKVAQIVVRDNALSCEKDYQSDLKFTENTARAVCPACETEVEWTALTAEATTLVKGNHYYLNADITFEETKAYLSGSTAESGRGTVCLHLNGHNITATKHRAINLCKATLNVMGTGTVSGNFTGNTNQGATLYAGYAAGRLNLYGGTFTKAESNTTNPAVTQLNGIINLYDGAAIENGYKMFVSNDTDTPKFNVNGGTVTGKADITAGTVTLSGAPKLTDLVIAEGVKLNLGEMTEGADITVSAVGIFTTANTKAVEYVGYFKPATQGDTVAAEDNVLCYSKAEN